MRRQGRSICPGCLPSENGRSERRRTCSSSPERSHALQGDVLRDASSIACGTICSAGPSQQIIAVPFLSGADDGVSQFVQVPCLGVSRVPALRWEASAAPLLGRLTLASGRQTELWESKHVLCEAHSVHDENQRAG